MISVTFCLAKSRHFYHILLYMSIFVCFFCINNTAKGNTSLMLNKLLLHIKLYTILKKKFFLNLLISFSLNGYCRLVVHIKLQVILKKNIV